ALSAPRPPPCPTMVGEESPAMRTTIGERVRTYRLRRGLTQARLAHLVGRSERWLIDVERGGVDPRLSDALALARELRVAVDDRARPCPRGRGPRGRAAGPLALRRLEPGGFARAARGAPRAPREPARAPPVDSREPAGAARQPGLPRARVRRGLACERARRAARPAGVGRQGPLRRDVRQERGGRQAL